MTRMKNDQEARRELVETAQANLGRTRAEIQLAQKRVEQALRRFPITSRLLEPVNQDLGEWEQRILDAQKLLRDFWDLGNERRWWP